MQTFRFVLAAFQVVAMNLAIFGIVHGRALGELVAVQLVAMALAIMVRERRKVT